MRVGIFRFIPLTEQNDTQCGCNVRYTEGTFFQVYSHGLPMCNNAPGLARTSFSRTSNTLPISVKLR